MNNTLPVRITAVRAAEEKTMQFGDYLLLLPLKGEVRLAGVDTQMVPQGTLLFLSPGLRRRILLRPGAAALYGLIAPDIFEKFIGISGMGVAFFTEETNHELLEGMFSLFDDCYNHENVTELRLMTDAYNLLLSLEKLLHHVKAEPPGTNKDGPAGEMTAWLEEHFSENISLGDFADAFGYSRQHISTLFHEITGTSFSDYLRQLRLLEAQRLLVTTKLTVTEISERSGFPNPKALHTAFGNYFGMTPANYRRENRMADDGELVAPTSDVLRGTNALLQDYRMVFARSDETVRISEKIPLLELPHTAFPKKWKDMLNIDSCVDCIQTEVQEQLREIQEELHFKYIRLTNAIHSDLILYLPAEGRHRFTRLFRLLEFFHGIDLIPMFVFGEAYLITRGAEMLNGDGYSVAREDWLRLLDELITAALRQWDREWVSKWRFEFHMPARLYGSEDPETFIALYADSAALIRQKLPGAQVGGPALSADSTRRTRWQAFLQAAGERKLPLDFVSMELWGDYTTEGSGFAGQYGEWKETRKVGHLSGADTALAMQRLSQVKMWMKEYGLSDTPLLISALGVTKYQAYSAQIGGHCAAYLVKCILELQNHVDGIGCWKALSNEAEYPDEYRFLSDGCGLLTRSGLKTPGWYAYKFLSGLLPEQIFRGIGSCVTGTKEDGMAILLYNCKNYSEKFCRLYLSPRGAEYDNPSFYQSWSAVTESMCVSGIPKGKYRVFRHLVGDHYGCLATVLRQLGDIDPRDKHTAEYLAGQSLPWQHNDLIEADGEMELRVTLQPNEIMLLRIVRVDEE